MDAGENIAAAGGIFLEAVKRHMGRRCANWDYSRRRIYMITICCKTRGREVLAHWPETRPFPGERTTDECTTGERTGDLAVSGEAHNKFSRSCSLPETARVWECRPTALGERVMECWRRIPEFWPEVDILEAAVMPDHFHGILFVKRDLPPGKHLGDIIRGFKTGSRTADWQEGYVDNILFAEGQLERMIAYLRDNPRRLAIKRENPDLFRVVSGLQLPLAFDKKPGIANFSAIGNRFLLDKPRILQVQASRRIAKDEQEEKKRFLLAAAREGAVLISPCISPGEREIARAAFEAKLPLIVMRNKGFSPLFKPPGDYFAACAEGRLLMIAPGNWPYIPGEKKLTRLDAVAMNRLCQLLAGDGMATINYKGMLPGDIDALARAAVCAS